jgi:thiol-disulfide isomerase/thioredoxin
MVKISPSSYLPKFGAAVAALTVFVGVLHAQLVKGSAFPSLTDAGLVGRVPETTGKVVLVDFWASWCAPCKASFPVYSKIAADFASRGVVIVAVSVDDDPAQYAAFIAERKPLFPTVHDAQHKLVSAVQVPTMPTSYLLDRNGKVRFVHRGFHSGSTEKDLRSEIEALLGEKDSAP